jgi:curved DNA-binding protein CbpA
VTSPAPNPSTTYYQVLGLSPQASEIEIRRAYRELSKRYHPDTTELAPEQALLLCQRLNEAYSILSHPERRSLYDFSLGYSRPLTTPPPPQRAAYLDARDRPLSAGEIFALFILALTLLGCLLIAAVVAMLRGEAFTIP